MVVRMFLALLLFLPAPALASAGTQVPEGSHLTLFALGVLGVIIGRRFSMHRPGRDREQD